MNKKFWMAGFLVIPKVYAVIASPFRRNNIDDVIFAFDTNTNGNLKCICIPCNIQSLKYPVTSYSTSQSYKSCARS